MECEICYKKFNKIIPCFSICTFKICKYCIFEIIDITSNDIIYKCPQCRKLFTYNNNLNFKEFCKKESDKIYSKFFNKLKYKIQRIPNTDIPHYIDNNESKIEENEQVVQEMYFYCNFEPIELENNIQNVISNNEALMILNELN